MNTALVILVIILLVILGANRIGSAFRNTGQRIKEDTVTGFRRGYEEFSTYHKPTETRSSNVVKKDDAKITELTDAFFNYADVEGWSKARPDNGESSTSNVRAVNNPVVSDMLDELNEHIKLEYHLPRLQVGVYSVEGVRDEIADEVQKIKMRGYSRFVDYNGYLIGYSKSQRN